MLLNAKAVDEAPVKAGCMSESMAACVDEVQDGPMDQRFLNSLNHWVRLCLPSWKKWMEFFFVEGSLSTDIVKSEGDFNAPMFHLFFGYNFSLHGGG